MEVSVGRCRDGLRIFRPEQQVRPGRNSRASVASGISALLLDARIDQVRSHRELISAYLISNGVLQPATLDQDLPSSAAASSINRGLSQGSPRSSRRSLLSESSLEGAAHHLCGNIQHRRRREPLNSVRQRYLQLPVVDLNVDCRQNHTNPARLSSLNLSVTCVVCTAPPPLCGVAVAGWSSAALPVDTSLRNETASSYAWRTSGLTRLRRRYR